MTRARGGSERIEQAPGAETSPRPAAQPGARSKSARPQGAGDRALARPEATSPSGAIINRRAADRLRAGHVWVYASDVVSLPPAPNQHLLAVFDIRGILLGTALYSPSSQIALRLVARETLDESAWLDTLAARLRRAIQRRLPMLNAETDACRLCFSEADELPGLIIDKYGPLVIVQRLVRGLAAPAVCDVLVRVLRDELAGTGIGAILERPDSRIRQLENLPAPSSEPLWLADPNSSALSAIFRLNGLLFHYDANSGQKTGAFLDQRKNYAAARDWARRLGATGRALDVCCYQGGFALHLATICRAVTGIDASRASLEVAELNLAANRDRPHGERDWAEVDWVEGDAFAILRDWSASGERFSTIVIDPPAFAKTRRAVESALRGYKELNLRALKMLSPGGLLVTCSCSQHVGLPDFESAIATAAADAGRRVRLLERRGAAPDHPVILNVPETEYLKCLVLEVE